MSLLRRLANYLWPTAHLRCEKFHWQYRCTKNRGHHDLCRFWLDSGDVVER